MLPKTPKETGRRQRGTTKSSYAAARARERTGSEARPQAVVESSDEPDEDEESGAMPSEEKAPKKSKRKERSDKRAQNAADRNTKCDRSQRPNKKRDSGTPKAK
jgi:hypothetical protein